MAKGKNKGNKAKTRRIVTKRFRVTKTGKVLSEHANTSHLNQMDDNSTSTRKKRMVQAKGKYAKKIVAMIIK